MRPVELKADTPERQLAATLVKRLNLSPPVDIFDVASRHAVIEECDWPSSCDGVALGLNSAQPRIYLKKIVNRRRMRFTLAHELGHVLLPWHVETIQCDVSKGGEVEEGQSEAPNAIGVTQELQANTFASHLLVPRNFLSEIAPGYVDSPDVLARLAQANVSASAGVMALASHLPAGYVFLVRGMPRMMRSSGTEIPFSWDGSLDSLRVGLASTSVRSGSLTHQDQYVEWFEFFQPERVGESSFDSDGRKSSEILSAVVESFNLASGADLKMASVASKIGGVLSVRRDIDDSGAIYTLLVYKFRSDARYAGLLESEDFLLYLHMKSSEISRARSGVKAGRSR
ncbi:ImmA/IrrE family metallo-endopeptidase [Streptomyces sp. NPDC059558]|uniref:ImmA/IrrE family metallo-endopeptidase n=1 Tax=Streptomyces sp. NPDC059558 TaxID=3346864 RepID=UPI0036B6C3E6